MENANSNDYLNKIKNSVIENLSRTKFAPSTQMQDVPRDIEGMDDEADAELDDLDEDENKDVRHTTRRWDQYVERDGELSDSEDEAENARNGVINNPGRGRRRNIMDHRNPHAPRDDSAAQTPGESPMRGLRGESGIAGRSDGSDMGGSERVELEQGEGEGDQENDADVEMEDEPPEEMQDDAGEIDMTAKSSPPNPLEMTLDEANVAAPAVADSIPEPESGEHVTATEHLAPEPSEAKEEGRAERNEDDMVGEARTEAAADDT